MTPRELLKRDPETTEHDFALLIGSYYSFIPEIGDDNTVLWEFLTTEHPRITIKIYKHFHFDYRRFWRLASVWFDDHPVMITQNAGREGDDHAKRFVLDVPRYQKMVEEIAKLPRKPSAVSEVEDVVELDEDLGESLTSFYGDNLDGYFRPYRY